MAVPGLARSLRHALSLVLLWLLFSDAIAVERRTVNPRAPTQAGSEGYDGGSHEPLPVRCESNQQ